MPFALWVGGINLDFLFPQHGISVWDFPSPLSLPHVIVCVSSVMGIRGRQFLSLRRTFQIGNHRREAKSLPLAAEACTYLRIAAFVRDSAHRHFDLHFHASLAHDEDDRLFWLVRKSHENSLVNGGNFVHALLNGASPD